VIGCFGFVEPYKGFFGVLDVLRRIAGTELVVYGTARSADAADRFAAACAGLPVRWCRDYLPSAEVARLLAAECDVLAFWYDEVPHASASGAVRVGLATGVPVLTSPTSWFADLRDVTYQPADLVGGVARLLDDTALRRTLTSAARDYCATHGWRRVAAEHLALWQSLESA
jgi:glycosyltransferase involved in cell wall biosynthesis